MEYSGPPTDPIAPPTAVLERASDRPVQAVWRNQTGGITFAIGEPAVEYVKWAPAGSTHTLADEATRLAWAAPFTPVPEVIDSGSDDDGAWLTSRALPYESAVAPRWKARPQIAANAIGTGLRALHDALPVAECPFSRSVEYRLASAGREPAPIGTSPPIDRLVVCHGDACAPNTLIDDSSRWAAHVDLGRLGVADRWADLAVATHNLEWNYGPGLEPVLLEAYGIDPDPARSAFYLRLWNLT